MKGYHFNDGKKLRDGRRLPEIGERLTHEGPVIPCESGLHFSEHPFDALGYAQGSCLDLIEGPDDAIAHGDPVDKFVGAWRVRIATIDVTPVLREFACRCALDVANYWDMPDVVRMYLDGTDRSDPARAAARAAGWDSYIASTAAKEAASALSCAFASSAARAAASASARDSAKEAAAAAASPFAVAAASAFARSAARAAAWDSSVARDSARDSTKEAAAASAFAVASAFASAFAWDSAWDSARDSQRKLFAEMVDAAFADNETGV